MKLVDQRSDASWLHAEYAASERRVSGLMTMAVSSYRYQAAGSASDAAQAELLAQDLNKRFPLDTQMQALWLPPIQAQLALDRKNPDAAVMALRGDSAIELGQIQFVINISCLSGVCTRRVIFGSRTGRRCRRRISEDSRP
jgi:hypothetical protein